QTRHALTQHNTGEPARLSTSTTSTRFERQIRALGSDGHAQLRATTIGVVGAGGLGAHVIQQLAHLGIGHLVVIDPDRVSTTNLSRLVGARRRDARLRRRKTHVARRMVGNIGGPTRVTTVFGSATDAEPARALLDCDVIIGCTDTQWSRTILNAIAYQYY